MRSRFLYNLKNDFTFCVRNAHKKQQKYSLFRNISTSENSRFESVVGLEIHAQINTKSKLFSDSPTSYGLPTNEGVSYFDAALPGTLPVLNKKCVEAGILTALALNCVVHKKSAFDRKHYFYPDLPAGYQITQHFHPLASDGFINFAVIDKKNVAKPYHCCSKLKQIQLEQDSGRSFHIQDEKSLVDLNRAGIGLMELVFEPDLKNGSEAAALVTELILILRQIKTCTCELEEGTLRVDANISVNKPGEAFGIRTEVKNINSMRFMARAIDYEIERQIDVILNGGTVVNETRSYDYVKKKTFHMRDKEMLQDYRFMPEPNLPPIILCDSESDKSFPDKNTSINVDELKSQLPRLPDFWRKKLMKNYLLDLEYANRLLASEGATEVFVKIASYLGGDHLYICTFLLNNIQRQLNARKLTFLTCEVTEMQMADVIHLVLTKVISEMTADEIVELIFNGDGRSAKEIVDQQKCYIVSDEKQLEPLCLQVIEKYEKVVKRYKKSQKKYDMGTLLVALNKMVNNRASIEDAEAVFKKLILNSNQNTSSENKK